MSSNVHDYDIYESTEETYEQYDPQDYEDYELEEVYHKDDMRVLSHGGQRVIRLGLLLLVLLLIAAVIIFGVIPYVDALNNTPPLLPPVQA